LFSRVPRGASHGSSRAVAVDPPRRNSAFRLGPVPRLRRIVPEDCSRRGPLCFLPAATPRYGEFEPPHHLADRCGDFANRAVGVRATHGPARGPRRRALADSLLDDMEPAVAQAAHAALKSLTKQDLARRPTPIRPTAFCRWPRGWAGR